MADIEVSGCVVIADTVAAAGFACKLFRKQIKGLRRPRGLARFLRLWPPQQRATGDNACRGNPKSMNWPTAANWRPNSAGRTRS
ncbi:hypothetical protein ACXIU3_24065, partial [Vibrio parahaemolyticus]